jgi:hypothetical protein
MELMTKVRAELRIHYDSGGRGPERSANPHARNAACAPLEVCLESVIIGNLLRYATDKRLPLAKTVWWGIN